MKSLFLVIGTTATLMQPDITNAAEIKVLSTQATEGAYRELVPQFEKATRHKVTTIFSGTLDVQKRLAAGESYDMIIMAAPAIDAQIKAGKVVAGSRVDIAKSGVAVGVPKGAPKPDISTTEALKKTVLAAKSIGYSTGPSGVYVINLFEKLGVAEQVKDKLKQTPTGVFVGSIIANREVEIGFQQVSELADFPGVDYVGPLPAEVQQTTLFSSGIIVGGKEAEAAGALVKFLTSPEAGAAFKKRGMEPG
ncbi:MAG TPA: substrate-binding domain-containing protein [Pseudolabrys sp.]|nr:substrate-binding domain-containing protein [Pseudolabrys sp.]